MTPTYPTTPKVKHLTGTRKREFFLRTQNTYRATGGWSGGSRDYFSLLNYKTGQSLPVTGQGDQFSVKAEEQELPKDSILIVTGVFCGKPATATIICRPEELQEVKKYLGVKDNDNTTVGTVAFYD